jgi:hypothetical protein
MKCHFCKIEMTELDEFCWKVSEPIKLETGELYSKKYICPKCLHFERLIIISKGGQDGSI